MLDQTGPATPEPPPTTPVPRSHLLLFATLPACLVLTGCREQPVVHYRLSKDPAPAPAVASTAVDPSAPLPADHPPLNSGGAAGSLPAATPASGPALAWTTPTGWQSQPAAAPRHAVYGFSGDNNAYGELVVTSFPGSVGGELANLNRWRGQLQLPAWSANEAAAAVQRLTAGELAVAVVDFTGGNNEAPVRLLGAIVPAGQVTWFFKFTGSPAVLEREKAAFLTLLESVHLKTTGEKDDHACCNS